MQVDEGKQLDAKNCDYYLLELVGSLVEAILEKHVLVY